MKLEELENLQPVNTDNILSEIKEEENIEL